MASKKYHGQIECYLISSVLGKKKTFWNAHFAELAIEKISTILVVTVKSTQISCQCACLVLQSDAFVSFARQKFNHSKFFSKKNLYKARFVGTECSCIRISKQSLRHHAGHNDRIAD